jgi:hypothetical protein
MEEMKKLKNKIIKGTAEKINTDILDFLEREINEPLPPVAVEKPQGMPTHVSFKCPHCDQLVEIKIEKAATEKDVENFLGRKD